MAAISIAPIGAEQRRPVAERQSPRDIAVSDFTDFFDLGMATDEHSREQAYKIRGDVYCKEFQYEPEESCPDGLEQDDHDGHSLHALITHRRRELPAGCVRLVLPNDYGPNQCLPLEQSCTASLNHPEFRPSLLPRSSQVEISRLAVHTVFRRRTGEKTTPDGMAEIAQFGDAERRAFPLIGSVLALAGVGLAELIGREHVFMMMEPRLARLLNHGGVRFLQVGELIEYHGQRAAFYMNTEEAVASIKPGYRDLYDYAQKTLWQGLCESEQFAIG